MTFLTTHKLFELSRYVSPWSLNFGEWALGKALKATILSIGGQHWWTRSRECMWSFKHIYKMFNFTHSYHFCISTISLKFQNAKSLWFIITTQMRQFPIWCDGKDYLWSWKCSQWGEAHIAYASSTIHKPTHIRLICKVP